MEFISLEDIVPNNHLLRKVESAINSEFIRDRVKDLYSPDNDRPSIDPVPQFSSLSFPMKKPGSLNPDLSAI